MKRYAQIDKDGICFAIIEANGSLDSEDMIKLHPHKDGDVLGKKYAFGNWETVNAPTIADISAEDKILAYLQFLLGKYCTLTFAEISQYYQKGVWSKSMLDEMVSVGKLKEDEYFSITKESIKE